MSATPPWWTDTSPTFPCASRTHIPSFGSRRWFWLPTFCRWTEFLFCCAEHWPRGVLLITWFWSIAAMYPNSWRLQTCIFLNFLHYFFSRWAKTDGTWHSWITRLFLFSVSLFSHLGFCESPSIWLLCEGMYWASQHLFPPSLLIVLKLWKRRGWQYLPLQCSCEAKQSRFGVRLALKTVLKSICAFGIGKQIFLDSAFFYWSVWTWVLCAYSALSIS